MIVVRVIHIQRGPVRISETVGAGCRGNFRTFVARVSGSS